MNFIKKKRVTRGIAQRQLAVLAGVSFRTIQLLESGDHDAKLSTLASVAKSLGYAPNAVQGRINDLFSQPVESVAMVSERLMAEGEPQWPYLVFEFVDALRLHKTINYIEAAPVQGLSQKMAALLASTVEALCVELTLSTPQWCASVPALPAPWFVSGIENLKALALVESPAWFRRRNIFVLENFLSRR